MNLPEKLDESTLARSSEPKPRVYLDKPQRLGILPTLGFWNQPEVWRLIGPVMAVFVGVWTVAISALYSGALSLWTLALIGGGGPLLMIGLIERYVRRRMRQRAELTASTQD